jgi:TolB protein
MLRKRKVFAAAVVTAALLSAVQATAAEAVTAPPGGRILYLEFATSTQDLGRLKSIQPNGQGGQDLGKSATSYSGPDYSPDGQTIAYTEWFNINLINADGSGDRTFAGAPSVPAYPRWSPDGQWIAAEAGGIKGWKTDGSGPLKEMTPGAYDNLAVAWAPDGRRIATATNSDEVRIYSADTGGLLKSWPLAGTRQLDWSPDGKTLIVLAQGDLWQLTLPTGAISRLTNTPEIYESSPTFSPDGRWVAYGRGALITDEYGNPDTADPVIWLMNSRGGNQHATSTHGIPTSWRTAS